MGDAASKRAFMLHGCPSTAFWCHFVRRDGFCLHKNHPLVKMRAAEKEASNLNRIAKEVSDIGMVLHGN